MISVSNGVRHAGILGILALAAAACAGDSAPAPPDTGPPTSEPAVAEAPAAPTTAPEPAAAVGEFDIDEDTTLREAFNAFADSEQACIRDALDDKKLESMLDMSLLSEDDIDQSMVWIFSCLDQETAREFFLSITMAALTAGAEEEGLSIEIGMDERDCVRGRLAGVNAASMVDALVSEFADPVLLGLLGCIPDLFIESILAEAGGTADELTEEQRSCLRDLIADTDWTGLGVEAASEGSELFVFGFGLLACAPDFMSADSASDPSSVPREDVADDHSNVLEEATPVAVGEAHPGEVQYEYDVDYFVFEAEQGRLYQIDVALGTLSDSLATLYDSDGLWLEHNDDYGDTSASRIYWEAQDSGSHYITVEGWSGDTGTYTLTIVTR